MAPLTLAQYRTLPLSQDLISGILDWSGTVPKGLARALVQNPTWPDAEPWAIQFLYTMSLEATSFGYAAMALLCHLEDLGRLENHASFLLDQALAAPTRHANYVRLRLLRHSPRFRTFVEQLATSHDSPVSAMTLETVLPTITLRHAIEDLVPVLGTIFDVLASHKATHTDRFTRLLALHLRNTSTLLPLSVIPLPHRAAFFTRLLALEPLLLHLEWDIPPGEVQSLVLALLGSDTLAPLLLLLPTALADALIPALLPTLLAQAPRSLRGHLLRYVPPRSL